MTSFMKEYIKKKPFYKKRWFMKVIGAVCVGAVFGTAAAIMFAVTLPWAQQNFGTPDAHGIGRESMTEAMTAKIKKNAVQKTEEGKAESGINMEDFKMLYSQIHEMAEEAFRGIVMVSGVSNGMDLFHQVYESTERANGLIVGIYSDRILILTEMRILEDAESILVTLRNDIIFEAQVKEEDNISGLALLEVTITENEKEQLDDLRMLPLGETKSLQQGEPVIGVGNLPGDNHSMAFGIVTSFVDTPVMDDCYQIVNTDITESLKGSGILINMEGEIIGIITKKFSNDGQAGIRAISSADISRILEEMTNGKGKNVMGITGKTVTEIVAKELEMPQGFYVTAVAPNSPAMYYGIQSGDILISMKDIEISDQKDYQNALKQCTIGEEISVEIMRKVRSGYSKMELTVQLDKK